MKRLLLFVLLINLTACAAYNPVESPTGNLNNDLVIEKLELVENHREKPAGFWKGLWHGVVLPYSFVGKMFNEEIGVYETYNTGNWYNFGFLIGISSWAGGSSVASKKK
jgi:hypothetical protein